ncbi:hypothetical protein DTO013E5_6977 [Penicillium roqueforti]|nr:hypothetical protein CBS147337_5626 [Penicillium roqueforti]KAI2703237.1 hypothetical protein CBS147372_3552 [Penicillium roqueforti]KAI2723016.1 hypothetical protein CBS147354_5502 [Penicillium roqueforti]KAI2738830.1 hypothetical protein DTO012A1_6531 [Penicillium roqueforti]KAI2750534.1 hypothetical protein DTO013F2_4603 [Penicillium roqueforti]
MQRQKRTLNLYNEEKHERQCTTCESRICKNSDGDDNGGHNSDASVVGESNGVTISNAIIKNQDDCLAVNSGTSK